MKKCSEQKKAINQMLFNVVLTLVEIFEDRAHFNSNQNIKSKVEFLSGKVSFLLELDSIAILLSIFLDEHCHPVSTA